MNYFITPYLWASQLNTFPRKIEIISNFYSTLILLFSFLKIFSGFGRFELFATIIGSVARWRKRIDSTWKGTSSTRPTGESTCKYILKLLRIHFPHTFFPPLSFRMEFPLLRNVENYYFFFVLSLAAILWTCLHIFIY